MKQMTDMIFTLAGSTLPGDHARLLWQEVVRALPWLEAEEQAGIAPLRAPEPGRELLLSRRARMVLRVPADQAERARELCGQTLEVDGHRVTVGEARERPLQPAPTLHAHLVASDEAEGAFLESMAAEMKRAGIEGKLICGKAHSLTGNAGKVSGYSLVVHELKPDAALDLQCCGLGGERHLGCGIFIPYKVIANLDD